MATVSQVNITDPDITESSDPGFAGANFTSKRHVGFVAEGQTHLVAEYNIASADGKYLAPSGKDSDGVEVWYQSNRANAAWEPYYSWAITNNYFTTTGKTNYINSCNLKVYYTPPVGIYGLDPDPVSPEGGFLSHLHDIRFTYTERTFVATTSKLTSVIVEKSTVSPSGNNAVTLSANSTGTVALSVRKLNAGKTDYTHSYNFTSNTFIAKASGLQSKTITFTEEKLLYPCVEYIKMPSTDESATYSVVVSAGTLALDPSLPDAINELNFETVQRITSTFGPGTKANVTNVAGAITTDANKELQHTNKTYPFTFTYTKTSGTMTLTRQPLETDVTGHRQFVVVTGTVAQGSSTITAGETEGVKAGMTIKDGNVEKGLRQVSRIPADTLVNTVSQDTNFTMKNEAGSAVATQDAITVDESLSEVLELTSDWQYEFLDMAATINEAASIVTVTGNLQVLRYGRSAPDGNIKLQPNFITIS